MTSSHERDPGANEVILPFSRAVRFHGHICPGLAIGYYASHIGMRWLHGHKYSSSDVVAFVDNAGCSVDAVQAITGCTVGKGNLNIRDYGKQVFTFTIRGTATGIRISLNPAFTVDRLDPGLADLQASVSAGKATPEEVADLPHRIERVCHAILESPGNEVFDIKEVAVEPQKQEQPAGNVLCASCGEPVNPDKAKKKKDSSYLCKPCQKQS